MNLVENMVCIKLSKEKRLPTFSLCTFLGHLHDLRPIVQEGSVVLEPKAGMRDDVVSMCTDALEHGLSSGAAAKLRGKATWLDTGLTGRCCRGALSALADAQYGRTSGTQSASTRRCLVYLSAVAQRAQPRVLSLLALPRAPVLVYTDASADSTGVRIGALLIKASGPAYGMVYDVPKEIVAPWRGGGEGINQGELFAANVLAWSAPELLRDSDVIWFIDNTSAESALVKSGSATASMSELALQAATFLVALRARPWYEWIPSDDNPADGFSRDGWDCDLATVLIRKGAITRIEPRPPPPVSNFVGVWDLTETLG